MKTNYIDVIVFVVLLIEFFVGINIGAIAIVFDILGIVLGYYVAKIFTPALALYLIKSFNLDKVISSYVSKLINIPQTLASLKATQQNLKLVIQQMHLPSFIQDYLMSGQFSPNQNILNYISLRLTQYLINAIAFIAIFVVVLLLTKMIASIFKSIIHASPFLKWIDVIFGGLLRVLLSLLIISLIVHSVGIVFNSLNLSSSEFLKTLVSSRTYSIAETYLSFLNQFINNLFATFK